GQRVAERRVALAVVAGRSVAERDVRVERRVLEACRALDRGDVLPGDAKLREGAKRRLLVGPEVPHRLVEADQPLLDQVVAVAADEEVRARLEPDERRVAPNQRVESGLIAVSGLEDEL